MTQKSRLLAYLQTHDGITSLEASRLPRPIMRLSQRIIELEAIGYRFDRIDERTDTAHFVRYKLKVGGASVSRTRTLAIAVGEIPAPATQCTREQYLRVRG